jgi:hypothetical protein
VPQQPSAIRRASKFSIRRWTAHVLRRNKPWREAQRRRERRSEYQRTGNGDNGSVGKRHPGHVQNGSQQIVPAAQPHRAHD